jgi:hypothetical protein
MDTSSEGSGPAPSPAAAPAPAPEAAAGGSSPAPEAVSPDQRRAKKDAIIKSVRAAAAKASGEPPPAEPKPAETPEPKPAETPKPAEPAPDAALTTRLAALEAELNETRGKLTEREKQRAAPTDVEGLLDLMADNPDMSIEKLSELYLKRQDNPAHKELGAAEKRLAAIEAKIAAGEKAEKDRAERTAQEATAAEGRKAMRGILDGDKARWPRLTRDERNATEAVSEAESKAGDRARALIAKGGKFTEELGRQMVAEALDEIEKDRADRATRYAMPDIPARRTIGAGSGSTGTIPQSRAETAEPLSRDQRKREILARVRAGQPKTS